MPVGPDGFRVPSASEGEAKNKLECLTGPGQDDHCRTFVINDEDHTLGNALKHIIIQNPAVTFCGYTVPHPMERKIHVRIQTHNTPAVQVFQQALKELKEQNEIVQQMIKTEVKKYQEMHPQEESMEQ